MGLLDGAKHARARSVIQVDDAMPVLRTGSPCARAACGRRRFATCLSAHALLDPVEAARLVVGAGHDGSHTEAHGEQLADRRGRMQDLLQKRYIQSGNDFIGCAAMCSSSPCSGGGAPLNL